MAHEFPVSVHWPASGEPGTTVPDFTRQLRADVPGKPSIPTSSASLYQGDDSRWNPEDLFGASLATCHLLTYLALTKKAGVDVRRYDDDVKVILESTGGPTRITQIRLAARIEVAKGTDLEKARVLFEKAHKYCFIGNSITSEVVMEPTFVEV